jgi:hypothetical protein
MSSKRPSAPMLVCSASAQARAAIGSGRVHIAGVTCAADGAWMAQVTRNLTGAAAGHRSCCALDPIPAAAPRSRGLTKSDTTESLTAAPYFSNRSSSHHPCCYHARSGGYCCRIGMRSEQILWPAILSTGALACGQTSGRAVVAEPNASGDGGLEDASSDSPQTADGGNGNPRCSQGVACPPTDRRRFG